KCASLKHGYILGRVTFNKSVIFWYVGFLFGIRIPD
ncbi:hypothetical protein GE061_015417, partial [Apolygus lucorum]